MSVLAGKHIILGITGGIAAYKSVYLLRLLVKAGADVQVVITPNGKEFITSVTLSSLSGRPVISEFFTANTGQWNSHVDLGLWADAMVIAPATASSIAKMANGVADNMLITSYLSARAQVFVAPAMDFDMMRHPSTTRNIDMLRTYGNIIIDSREGELASHLVGKGRMAEPEEIIDVLERYFARSLDCVDMNVLVTAGPTHEPIDPVRFIGNYSSGKMGYAIANEFASRGANVTLVSGPVGDNIPVKDGINVVRVTTARQMLEACKATFNNCNVAVMAAAVADYAPAKYYDSKIKREEDGIERIELVKNPDIAATLGVDKTTKQILVGFALETDNEIEHAQAKMSRKNLDAIVVNSLRDKGAGFGVDTNRIRIMYKNGEVISYDTKPKTEVATDIVDAVVAMSKR